MGCIILYLYKCVDISILFRSIIFMLPPLCVHICYRLIFPLGLSTDIYHLAYDIISIHGMD